MLIFKLLQNGFFQQKQAENSSRSHWKEITANLRFHKFCILYKKAGLSSKKQPAYMKCLRIYLFAESNCSSLCASRFSKNFPFCATEILPVSSETMIAIASDFSETPIAER